MTIYYYTFRSMTAAMNASGKLRERGISATPVRTPEHLRKQGCGYCIPVPEGRMRSYGALLLPEEFEKLYLLQDGKWKELIP